MPDIPAQPWAVEGEQLLAGLETSHHGLDQAEAERRLAAIGPNELEESRGRGPLRILVDQFRSPLIYILLVAAAVTILLEEYPGAGDARQA